MKRPGSGGTFSSKYCYSVWLRHLHYLLENNLFKHPVDIKNVAELGPGDSLGIGLSSMYTGTNNYFALDVIKHANLINNQIINSDLLLYFKNRNEIPHGKGFEYTSPTLDNYEYPKELIGLNNKYFSDRYHDIDKAIMNAKSSPLSIDYIVPWNTQEHQRLNGSLDLIISQAVMEHVDDIESAYASMFKWLRKGGVISHQIDFKTHEMTKEWNGHFYIGEKTWRFLSSSRKYPINRLPLSTHLNFIKKAGFSIKFMLPVKRTNNFGSKLPSIPNVEFSKSDLETSGVLIQAVK